MFGPLYHIDPDCESSMEDEDNLLAAGIIEESKRFMKIMTINKDANNENLFKFLISEYHLYYHYNAFHHLQMAGVHQCQCPSVHLIF